MDIKTQVIQEYLETGAGYRKLAAKYGISRTTINKWVMIHQGIHNISATAKQQQYYLSAMNSSKDKKPQQEQQELQTMQQKIALLEKQLEWEKMRTFALDKMIDIAEDKLNISIRKKSGNQQSKK
jgi:transposase-like protein